MHIRLLLVPVLLASAMVLTTGCVRRTLRITSEPPGALVWVNHREVGRTPLEIDFTYYGHYDVKLAREGSEPMLTTADANPPVWDAIGLDFVFEVAPFESQSVVEWHFDLEPRLDDLDALVERARALRTEIQPKQDMPTVTLDRNGHLEGEQAAPRAEESDSN